MRRSPRELRAHIRSVSVIEALMALVLRFFSCIIVSIWLVNMRWVNKGKHRITMEVLNGKGVGKKR